MGRVVKEEGQSLHFKSLKKLQPRGTYINTFNFNRNCQQQ